MIGNIEQSKLEMAAKCLQCAKLNTPKEVTNFKWRTSLTGRASYSKGMIASPKPKTRKALYIYLHECAHFVLHKKKSSKKKYIQEYEAEKWAHEKMREYGIKVPRDMTKQAKKYVSYKIGQACRRGLKKIDPEVKKWVKS